MKCVLGISTNCPGASAALVCDGKVIAAAAEERFTRQLRDPSFPRFAIDFCLRKGGLAAQELDEIVFFEEPHTKFTRVLSSVLAPYPFSRTAFVRSMKKWIGSELWIKNEISKKLDVHPRKISFIPHHLSHAAQAFIGSSFEQAAILTLDTAGEWDCTGLYWATSREQLEIKRLEAIPYPHSLGFVYAVFTAFLGFLPFVGEANTMVLAAFGQPTYADGIRKIIQIQADGTYRIDPTYFHFDDICEMPHAKKFIEIFGSPRHLQEELPFNCHTNSMTDPNQLTAGHQRFADIAASLQLVIEEALIALVCKLHKLTGSKNLCLAGDLALNCVANRRILEVSPFESLFVPPDPGEGGAALGAALFSCYQGLQIAASDLSLTPFLGNEYDESEDAKMLRFVKPDEWIAYRKSGCSQVRGIQLDIQTFDHFDHLLAGVVEDLRQGKIVGWFQGRFEYGSKGLGNRSLLFDPSNIAVAQIFRQAVKSRPAFVPYALSIIQEQADKILELDGQPRHAYKWMHVVAPVKNDRLNPVQAAVHINKTTLPQICSRDDNPRYHQLLSSYGDATGCAALLNASLNETGFPMASSPAEALLLFARTNINTLVINNLVVRKI